MELRATREMRRNGQLSKAMAKKADTSYSPAKAQPAKPQAPTDKVSLSRQALAFVQEQNRKMWEAAQQREQRRQNRMNDSLSALDSAKSELDLLEKAMDVQEKCLKIAASIMKGNRVPPEDLEYLMNNDPEGYKLAMAMRRENPAPEDEESVLGEEDRNGSVRQAGGGESREGSSAAEAPSGGGEASAPAEQAL